MIRFNPKSLKKFSIAGGIVVLFLFLITLFVTSPAKKGLFQSIPTPTPYQPPIPPVYKKAKTQQMIDTIENRPQLSNNDATVKKQLSNWPTTPDGVVLKTNEYIIFYTPSADLFQVEIDVPNITQAKKDANAWFLGKGLSQTGICKLPVTFYLTQPVLQKIEQENIQFNPLPDNC